MHGTPREPERRRNLVGREAPEDPVLDDACGARVETLQPVEQTVHGEHLIGVATVTSNERHVVAQRHDTPRAALEPLTPTSMVDEHPPHHARSDAEKLLTALRIDPDSTMKGVRGALLVLAVTSLGTPARATVLTFDQVRIGGSVVPTISGNAVPQDYGDRVSGEIMPASGGSFTYGEGGEGYTPAVEVEYFGGSATSVTSAASLWHDGYGTLENVLFGNQNSSTLNVRLTADAGVDVLLYGFDLGGWYRTDHTVGAIRVLSGGQPLFEAFDVVVHGAVGGPGRTTIAFATPIAAHALLLTVDSANLAGGQQDNIGLDNIRFGQSVPPDGTGDDGEGGESVPEPASVVLAALAVGALAARRRRSKPVLL